MSKSIKLPRAGIWETGWELLTESGIHCWNSKLLFGTCHRTLGQIARGSLQVCTTFEF